MFQMFGVKGASCPRCERKLGDDARYCAGCGMIVGAPRNAPVLVDNRWVAGADELAVFFGVRELSGVFVKTLRVPATARAFILQGDKATEVPQGEYEIEGFFTRLNHLLRDQHAEILVTRTGALPVDFRFDDVCTSEQLAVSARLAVSLRIENVPAFARHFMTMPGTIGTRELQELLAAPVRQLLDEFVGARSIRDMAGTAALREQLDERLQGGLKLLLAEYGLAVVKVDTVELRHDKYDANRARVGSLWLAADERHVQVEHRKHLDELYDAEEWQRLRRSEQQARVRQREAELRQDDAIARAELSLAGAGRAHAVRARQIELYARILDAQSRKQALERGAGDVLAELEHELAKKGAARADDAQEWKHLRAMAQVRMRSELELAQQDAQQARHIARQRFSQQLLQQQIRHKIEQAALIEDATRQRAELQRLRASEEDAARRSREIDEEEHVARHQSLALANAARRREAGRLQEWEDEQARQKIESTRSAAQQEKLLRTIELDARQARELQGVALEGEERRHALRMAEGDSVAQQELRRLETFAAMDDTAKLALAAAPNAAALNDFMKTRVHATMDAAQLAALSGVAGAGKLTPPEALALVREEQARRELEVDKDRRHQVALLAAQTNLATGMAAAVRQCAHGHPAREGERFCATCGAPLPT
ncbi:hypothetical protein [Massilia yuzhufengensis]|uniref:Band 7 domain-containing protein n=1 Tax=Massilia yuzhufengensis TaxID=1164594 RepID=A0A1I1PN08_9BURK|nr:hypothetical protein [Massilia yuzhufengensis]SFD11135.1 hypothetical protein SAMN05216204_11674 [Massilia yuzhufengensis]